MKAVALLLLLAACAPDPFGTDCRTSPSCQKREDKKRRAAQTDRANTCKAAKQVWLENNNSTMPCDAAKSGCSSSYGCAVGATCVNETFCIDGESWAGYCGVCGDRAALTKGLAAEQAETDRRAKIRLERSAIGEAEIKAGKCSDRGRTDVETGIDSVVKDLPGTLHKRGTIVATSAGLDLTVEAVAGTRYTLTIGGVDVGYSSVGGVDFRSGSWNEEQHLSWMRESNVATGNTLKWTVKGIGCVAWHVVRDK